MRDAAAVLGAIGALGLLLGRPRAVLLAALVTITAAEVLFAGDLLPRGFDSVVSPKGAAAVVLGVPVLAALAWGFVRFPAAVPPAVVGLAPFRLPFDIGTEHRFFVGLGQGGALGRLIPLYTALAAAGAALAWRAVREEEPRPLPTFLAAPAALLTALMSLSLLWAYDGSAAATRIAFFVLPFAVLLRVVAAAPFRPWLPRVLAIEAVALGCLFAAVGIAEEWTHRLLFYEPKLSVANNYTSYFRVTSLFSDPSIYARHLVVVLTIVVVVALLAKAPIVLCTVAAAFIWTGLYFSYSQSSLAALGVAAVLVTTVAGGRRTRQVLGAGVVVLLVAGFAAFAIVAREHSADRIVSGRWTLAKDAWVVFADHPVAGVGIASQPAASRDVGSRRESERRTTSHTAPLTIAAELGAAGLFLYLAFLAAAVRLCYMLRARDDPLGLGVLGVLAVLVVHSLSYGVFFEDPLLWAALGVGAATALGRERLAASTSRVPPRVASAPAPAAR